MTETSSYHNPVLLKESIDALITNPDGIYADATFGGGGHSREIISRLGKNGRLISFDRDEDALKNAIDDSRFTLIHNNFRFIHNYSILLTRPTEAKATETRSTEASTTEAKATETRSTEASTTEAKATEAKATEASATEARPDGNKDLGNKDLGTPSDESLGQCENGGFDGIIADLGVSSHQFDTAERGFSFRYSAPLDMRMNVQGKKTAADIVNSYTQEELENVLKLYGEVDNARKVATLICAARTKAAILTTDDLGNAIAAALPTFAEHKVLAKIYQALRIEVNQEMRSLEKFLEGAAKSLKPGGRLVVITYHSLEDRMVKNFIKTGNVEGIIKTDIYGRSETVLEAVNRKPILPEESEIKNNTRARSAKLRIAEKKR